MTMEQQQAGKQMTRYGEEGGRGRLCLHLHENTSKLSPCPNNPSNMHFNDRDLAFLASGPADRDGRIYHKHLSPGSAGNNREGEAILHELSHVGANLSWILEPDILLNLIHM